MILRKTALTIAGFDPSGGAGILADIKTFQKNGCYGVAIPTALTVQNTQKVFQVEPVDVDLIENQLIRLIEDIEIDAIKIGMLQNRAIIKRIFNILKEIKSIPIILDPIILSSSNYPLIDELGLKAMINNLFHLVTVLTPNIPETEKISGMLIRNREDLKKASQRIIEMGIKAIIVKGGHLELEGDDYFSDGINHKWLKAKSSTPSDNIHGTGCVFSSILTAKLAFTNNMMEAIDQTKSVMTENLHNSFRKGHGKLLIC